MTVMSVEDVAALRQQRTFAPVMRPRVPREPREPRLPREQRVPREPRVPQESRLPREQRVPQAPNNSIRTVASTALSPSDPVSATPDLRGVPAETWSTLHAQFIVVPKIAPAPPEPAEKQAPPDQDLSGHIGGVETSRGDAESPDSVATRVEVQYGFFPMIGEQPIFHTPTQSRSCDAPSTCCR